MYVGVSVGVCAHVSMDGCTYMYVSGSVFIICVTYLFMCVPRGRVNQESMFPGHSPPPFDK